jgi:hypothetical protein
MLDRCIQELHLKLNNIGTEQWKYHVSGNSIELSIPRPSIFDKEKYRSSVITTGQVIKSLAQTLDDLGCHFHIQSFPNFENPEVIAVIRIENEQRKKPVFPETDSDSTPSDFASILEQVARQYHFHTDEIHPEEFFTLPEDKPFETQKCIALLSNTDNPFTWLNIGYMKESLLTLCCNQPNGSLQFAIDICESKKRKRSSRQNGITEYVQALILI